MLEAPAFGKGVLPRHFIMFSSCFHHVFIMFSCSSCFHNVFIMFSSCFHHVFIMFSSCFYVVVFESLFEMMFYVFLCFP